MSGEYGMKLLKMYTGDEVRNVLDNGDDWYLISNAIADWAGAMFASTNVTKIPFPNAMNVLSSMIQSAYMMGYNRGKRDAVIGMDWRVGEEQGGEST